jgi:DNA-dependent RNA polymerase auxiliary subunit epsilon
VGSNPTPRTKDGPTAQRIFQVFWQMKKDGNSENTLGPIGRRLRNLAKHFNLEKPEKVRAHYRVFHAQNQRHHPRQKKTDTQSAKQSKHHVENGLSRANIATGGFQQTKKQKSNTLSPKRREDQTLFLFLSSIARNCAFLMAQKLLLR